MRFTFPRVHNSCSPPRDILQILSSRLKQRGQRWHVHDVWNESNNDSRLLIPHLLPHHRIRILANRDRGHSHCRRRCCRNDNVRDITRSKGVNSNNTLARTIRGKALIRILGHASSWITFVQCPMGWRL